MLILFDLAGTLMHDGAFALRAYQRVIKDAGMHAEDDWLRSRMGKKKQAVFEDLLRTSEFNDHNRLSEKPDPTLSARSLALAFENTINQLMTDETVKALPSADACIKQLRNNGHAIGYTTGFAHSTAELIARQLNWSFDTGAASDEVVLGRPAPELIHLAMERARVTDPKTVVAVGDTPWDLLSGRQAQCRLTIGVTHGTHTREELEIHPHDAILDDLHPLADLVQNA